MYRYKHEDAFSEAQLLHNGVIKGAILKVSGKIAHMVVTLFELLFYLGDISLRLQISPGNGLDAKQRTSNSTTSGFLNYIIAIMRDRYR
jgi:hypothetical protein